MQFGLPFLGLGASAVAAVICLMWARRRPARLPRNISRVVRSDRSWRVRLRPLVAGLYVVAAGLLVIAAAQPRSGVIRKQVPASGVAIQLVVDRSGSMERDDYQIDDQWVTRLQAVQQATTEFLEGDRSYSGREGDVIGLISFAGRATLDSWLTHDHPFVAAELIELQPATSFRDDGTAIGDAVGLAVSQLESYADAIGIETMADKLPGKSKMNKVVLLFTDGEQNAGRLSPAVAAALAAGCGVRIHAVFLGEDRGDTQAGNQGALDALRLLTDQTGGRLFYVASSDDLAEVHREIDRLEVVPVEDRTYTDFRELAVQPLPLPGSDWTAPSLVGAAFFLLVGYGLLSGTSFRTFPY